MKSKLTSKCPRLCELTGRSNDDTMDPATIASRVAMAVFGMVKPFQNNEKPRCQSVMMYTTYNAPYICTSIADRISCTYLNPSFPLFSPESVSSSFPNLTSHEIAQSSKPTFRNHSVMFGLLVIRAHQPCRYTAFVCTHTHGNYHYSKQAT